MQSSRLLVLTAALVAILTASAAIDGSWRGDLNVAGTTLPIVFNFTAADPAACTIDSPSQGAYGLPATVDYQSADSIAVSSAALGATFRGHIAADKITGTFAQRGLRLPLDLTADRPISERRPQTPCPPFPYTTVDTTFRSADGTILSATITLPADYQPGVTPICVLVTGSGPQNRDEELFEHRPFAVIADHLGRNSIATLRYDDRGVAQSQGDYASATLSTFTDDARAALHFAKAYTHSSPTGILGHSEGGTIALLLAAEHEPDFAITLAAMAVSGKETILDQNRRALLSAGIDQATIDDTLTLLSDIFDQIIARAADTASAADTSAAIDVDATIERLGLTIAPALLSSLKANLASTISSDYFASLLAVDARTVMPRITCSILALNGTLDTQVDPTTNLDAIRRLVPTATALELPGLNHLFQQATTGTPDEYPRLTQTLSPTLLTLLPPAILHP